MGKRSVKKPFSFLAKRLRSLRRLELQAISNADNAKKGGKPAAADGAAVVGTPALGYGAKVAKKKAGARLWMRFDRMGHSEVLECDRSVIIKRAAIPARDLRILGPFFSQSSNILAREKAMVVNLEFIKTIVTAEEVLLLDPLSQEVLPFVDRLRQQLPPKGSSRINGPGGVDMQSKVTSPSGGQWSNASEPIKRESGLPFEFQVLEIAMEVVCSYLDSGVADLERNAYPVLDELAMKVSTKKLEIVRSLKSNLTHLLARVQKVRDEIEHLLGDNEVMAQLYLTRKQIQDQQFEALLASGASNSIVAAGPILARLLSNKLGSASIISSIYSGYYDVEDLEMLLEAYFMQLDGIRNRILSVREYIDDTEDYVNIQLDNQRNELIQLQLFLTITSCAISIDQFIVGAFAMNLNCQLFNMNGIFWPFFGGTSGGCFLIYLLMLGYARWKKLLG